MRRLPEDRKWSRGLQRTSPLGLSGIRQVPDCLAIRTKRRERTLRQRHLGRIHRQFRLSNAFDFWLGQRQNCSFDSRCVHILEPQFVLLQSILDIVEICWIGDIVSASRRKIRRLELSLHCKCSFVWIYRSAEQMPRMVATATVDAICSPGAASPTCFD